MFFLRDDLIGKKIHAKPFIISISINTTINVPGKWNADEKREGKIPAKAATIPMPVPDNSRNRFSVTMSARI